MRKVLNRRLGIWHHEFVRLLQGHHLLMPVPDKLFADHAGLSTIFADLMLLTQMGVFEEVFLAPPSIAADIDGEVVRRRRRVEHLVHGRRRAARAQPRNSSLGNAP